MYEEDNIQIITSIFFFYYNQPILVKIHCDCQLYKEYAISFKGSDKGAKYWKVIWLAPNLCAWIMSEGFIDFVPSKVYPNVRAV